MGRPWTGPDGKGFLSGKGGERCLSPAFFHQKNLFKAALTQLKTSHRPFKQGHCSGHHASDVPTWDRNWKSPLGRLPQLSNSSGRTVMSQVSESDRALFSTDTPNVGSISCRPVYGDWRRRDCPFDGERLLEYVELVWPGHDWLIAFRFKYVPERVTLKTAYVYFTTRGRIRPTDWSWRMWTY